MAVTLACVASTRRIPSRMRPFVEFKSIHFSTLHRESYVTNKVRHHHSVAFRTTARRSSTILTQQQERLAPTVSSHQKASFKTIADGEDMNLYISCLPGLEPVLSHELNALSIPHSPTDGGFNLRGASHEQLLKCHLYLGAASHVLLRCGRPFRARNFGELRRKMEKTHWSTWLVEDVHIMDIRVSASKSKLYHTAAIAERVRKGIYKVFGREETEASGEDDEEALPVDSDKAVKLTVRIVRDMVQISIDTSVSPLHQRGYRLETAKAPLREDLAYALLYSAGWYPYYKHRGYHDSMFGGILDPFCGAGTIPIEGASMLAGLAPGRLRDAPLGGTHLFDPALWKSMTITGNIMSNAPQSKTLILGTDRDVGAIGSAISNADRAGVSDLIDFQQAALASNPWFENPSLAPDAPLVATNPPFGKRIKGKNRKEVKSPLLPLFQTLGTQTSRLYETKPGTGVAILATDRSLVRRNVQLPNMHVAFSSHHGGLEVSMITTSTAKLPYRRKRKQAKSPRESSKDEAAAAPAKQDSKL